MHAVSCFNDLYIKAVLKNLSDGLSNDEAVSDYDCNGNLTESSDQRSGTTPFEYDPLGRITRAGGQTFAFDPAHNILDPTAHHPVSGNRLQRYNGHSYYYDDYGNTVQHETADGSQHNLYYDLYDRLEKAEVFRRNESGGWDKQTWVYQYDALDRRIRKGRLKEDGGLEDETRFVWDGSRLLQEVYARGRYTYVYADQDSYEPLAQIHNYTNAGFETYQEINYFHCDQIGIPREMTDRDGRLLWFGDYDGWGRLNGETNITGAHQPFRLQNQYCDAETGLHYNFYRYYEPNSGRFINQDPIGLWGGENLYAFAPNAQGWVDPLGLSELLKLVMEAHSQLDQTAQRFKTTAIGRSTSGKLFISSSDNIVPKVQRTWAESKGITVINMKDAHAEESLIKSGKGITEIEASRPVCLDCEDLMNGKGVKSKTPRSGKKSRKRRNIGRC